MGTPFRLQLLDTVSIKCIWVCFVPSEVLHFISLFYISSHRLVYKWFLAVHKVTYGLGIVGYVVIMCTLLGLNLMFLIRPDVAMEFGVVLLFYGLYFGVLGRDFAEICADKMAAKLGVSTFVLFLLSVTKD